MTDTPRLKPLGDGAGAHLAIAKTLFQKGRYVRALDELDRALVENPELAEGHLLSGVIHYLRADYQTARACLETALRIDDGLGRGWLTLSKVHSELGDAETALAAAERAVATGGNGLDKAHFEHGNLLSARGALDEACAAYERALAINAHLVQARYRLAHLLERQGRSAEATEQVVVAQRLSPTNYRSRLTLGELLLGRGDLEGAIAEFKAASELARWQALPYARLGQAYFESGLLVEAAAAAGVAIKLDPKNVDSLLCLARVLSAQGNRTQALEVCRSAVEVDPRFPESQALLAALSGDAPPEESAGTGS